MARVSSQMPGQWIRPSASVWDAKPEKGSPMVPGLWEIVGMSGNTLIIKLKQEK